MRLATKLAIAAGAAIAVTIAFLAPLPIPPDRVLSEERSPDGLLIAQFSWRPAGVLGAITEDNPWVYVTIRDGVSNAVVQRYRTWGDVPSDAYDRLAQHVPWRAANEARRPTSR
jgi:hypothetical protein